MKKKIDGLARTIAERLGALDVQKVSTKKLLEGLDTLGLSPRSIRNAVAEVEVPNWSKAGRSFFRDKCKSLEISANERPRFMPPAELRSLYMNKAKARAETVAEVEPEKEVNADEDWSHITSGADF